VVKHRLGACCSTVALLRHGSALLLTIHTLRVSIRLSVCLTVSVQTEWRRQILTVDGADMILAANSYGTSLAKTAPLCQRSIQTSSGVAKGGGTLAHVPSPVVVRVKFFKSSRFGSVTTGYDTLLKFWSAWFTA